nr:hypothetical protein [Tanacetum cinerariifolium]
MQTQTSNTLHNAIMEAASKDRPPMLAPGNYVQWKSRIKRYIDTKPNHELIHYCPTNPPYELGWIDKEIPISEGSPIIRTEKFQETYKNVSQDIRDQLNAKAKAVQIILTWIDNDIYSTVDVCPNNQELKTVSYYKLYDILKQHQHEVNEIRAKRIARTANPLALVAQQQPVYHPQTHPTHYTQNSSTRSQQAVTMNRGKAIVNSPQPIYDQEPSMVAEDDETDDTDDDELEDQELEAYYMYMAQLQEVSPDAADSRPIFDDEPLQKVSNDDHYILFAMESEHPEQSKSVHDTYPIEQDAQNVIIDSLDMSYDREEIDQNDNDNDLANERELLASLIEKLKREINESKNHNKFLETSNKVLIEKLKGEIEDFKTKNKSLESSNNRFKEANNKLSETNNLLYTNYKKSEAELARCNSMEYASQMETECAKKEAQIKLYKTREDKELEKVIALENKVKFLDNIVYKTGQSVQTMNMLNNKCRTSFAKPEFLKKAQRANPRLYDIGCYNDNLALMLAPESDEFLNEIERLSKEYYYADHMNAILDVYTELDEVTNLQSDYLELLEKYECLETELSKRLESSVQDKVIVINELKKLIEKLKGKSVDTKFEKSSIIQQPNAFKSQRPSVLDKQTTFSNSFLVEIVQFIVDSGCSKHMTRNLKLLINFVEKFLGMVKFRNDQIAPILGYRDLGNDLLTGSCGTDLYSITLQDTKCPNPICLMAKASSSQAWLWHLRLSHLNFDTINLLSKNDIVVGLPKLKFVKDHLCSSCELRKAKRKSFHTKLTLSSKRRLQLLHMDLCGPMRVASINGKRYVLVIVDDYSRYTWTHFLRSKDETPKVLINYLRLVQKGLQAQVRIVRTDKGTEFLNHTLHAYFAAEGILHQTSVARTPEQNGVVERRNRTLVEAAQTMLSTAKVPLFFWAEAISTACFTKNSSLVIPRDEKTPTTSSTIENRQLSSFTFLALYVTLSEMVKILTK